MLEPTVCPNCGTAYHETECPECPDNVGAMALKIVEDHVNAVNNIITADIEETLKRC